MPQKSPHQIDIPATDVLSYVFPKGRLPSEKPIWIDAEHTKRSLSPAQLLQWVKRLGSGLDKLGLGQNEVVMMYSSNHIFVPVLYLGVAGSGRIFSGCNPAYGVDGRTDSAWHAIWADFVQKLHFRLKILERASF